MIHGDEYSLQTDYSNHDESAWRVDGCHSLANAPMPADLPEDPPNYADRTTPQRIAVWFWTRQGLLAQENPLQLRDSLMRISFEGRVFVSYRPVTHHVYPVSRVSHADAALTRVDSILEQLLLWVVNFFVYPFSSMYKYAQVGFRHLELMVGLFRLARALHPMSARASVAVPCCSRPPVWSRMKFTGAREKGRVFSQANHQGSSGLPHNPDAPGLRPLAPGISSDSTEPSPAYAVLHDYMTLLTAQHIKRRDAVKLRPLQSP